MTANQPAMGMTSAEKMRAMRERAAAAGKCLVCTRRKPMAGKTVCRPCNEEAKLRVYRSRGHDV